MKTTRILSLAMTMAMGMIAGLQASVTDHRPPAPLPEFKTPEQLAKWRSETTAKTSAQEASRLSTLDSSTPFYTGKPYLAESGSYTFKYREYNPEMNRWTTVDPSGFPDGANNRVYAAVPTSQVDWEGTITINFGTANGEMVYNLTWTEVCSITSVSLPVPSVTINWSMTTPAPNSTQTVNNPIVAPTGLNNFQWVSDVMSSITYTPKVYANTGWTVSNGSTRNVSSTETINLTRAYSYTTE